MLVVVAVVVEDFSLGITFLRGTNDSPRDQGEISIHINASLLCSPQREREERRKRKEDVFTYTSVGLASLSGPLI